MQQIVASHGLSNIFSLVYWSEKPEVKSPCTSVMCRCKQTKTKCQTKVANHTDVADIVVNSACFTLSCADFRLGGRSERLTRRLVYFGKKCGGGAIVARLSVSEVHENNVVPLVAPKLNIVAL